jgi:1A family penicillin-binding protein
MSDLPKDNDSNMNAPLPGACSPDTGLPRRRLRLPRLFALRHFRPRMPRFRGSWSRMGLAVLAALLIAATVAPYAWWRTCGFDGCPSVAELRAWRPTEGGAVLDVNGQLLGPLVPVKRQNVPLARVPTVVRNAFIAVEDHRFREHHGVDWRGVARAALVNLKSFGVREGASTISMQLARNVFLADRASERTFGRKFLEWRYAGLLEAALTKDQILERYLNAIYLGNGVYGVEGASQDLFGKSVSDVTLAEAAMLAGLPKAPTSYSPRRDRQRARTRRDLVLSVLEREGVAKRGAIVAAHAFDVQVVNQEWVPSRVTDGWALELARSAIDSLRVSGALPAGLTNANLVVHTTFDRRAQRAAERAVLHGAAQVDAERFLGVGTGDASTQGALVALDPNTGAIRALVGGRRIERRGFDRALFAKRQPGSAFKPFVYAAALQNGYTTATLVDDEPVSVQAGNDTWTPANFDDEYGGRITVRQALTRSANAATVRISRDVGIPRVASLAQRLGVQSTLPLVPALALGAGEVTPLELATAYVPFGNGGERVTPYMLVQVDDAFGRVQWRTHAPTTTRVLDSADAFLVTSMLRSVVDEGTGRAVRSAGIKGAVAGKTGTTNDGADVWFVGYTPTIVASIWFGNDTPQPLGANATGGRLAAPAWSEFLRDGWHSPARDTAWAPPASLITRQIDVASGQLAASWCGESRRDWFKPGTEPREQCSGAVADTQDWVPNPVRDVMRSLPGRDLNSAVDAVMQQIGRHGIANDIARKVAETIKRAAAHERNSARRVQQHMVAEQARVQRDVQRDLPREIAQRQRELERNTRH